MRHNIGVLDTLKRQAEELEITLEGKRIKYRAEIQADAATLKALKARVARLQGKADEQAKEVAERLIPYDDFAGWKAKFPRLPREDQQAWANRVGRERDIAHGKTPTVNAPLDPHAVIASVTGATTAPAVQGNMPPAEWMARRPAAISEEAWINSWRIKQRREATKT